LREGGNPAHGGDYAIEHLRGVDVPFVVRILLIRDVKLGGTLIDTEIAGQRTMLTFRPELWVDEVTIRGSSSTSHSNRQTNKADD
jgi:hypothetical protein